MLTTSKQSAPPSTTTTSTAASSTTNATSSPTPQQPKQNAFAALMNHPSLGKVRFEERKVTRSNQFDALFAVARRVCMAVGRIRASIDLRLQERLRF